MLKLLRWFFCLCPLVAVGQVAQYPFITTFGTYVPLIGGTTLGGPQNDDATFNALPIGFTFNYNGVDYTQFSVNTNGFIVMGPVATGTGAFIAGASPGGTVFSSATGNNEVIAAFNMDIIAQPAAELSYQTIGTAPAQTLVVQWAGYRAYARTPANDTLNFQIWLHEGTNLIEVKYGRTVFALAATPRVQVGLRGSNNTDYNSRTGTDWAVTSRATANTQGMDLAGIQVPQNGLVYAWSRPTTGTNLSVRSIILPSENNCRLTSITPLVEMQNGGATVIDTVIASYSVNNRVIETDTLALPSSIFPGERALFQFNTTFATPAVGTYRVQAAIRALREDTATLADNVTSADFISTFPVSTLPHEQGFSSTTSFPANWRASNLRGRGNWTLMGPNIPVTANGGQNAVFVPTTTGGGAAFYNSFSSTFDGGLARLVSPCFSLANLQADSLLLEVSYLQSNAFLTREDSIAVLISTDFGVSYTFHSTLYRPTTDVPQNQGKWTLATLDLGAYIREPNIRFAFDAGGADGTNCAIDFIRLRPGYLPVGTKALRANSLRAYPNPASQTLHIAGLPQHMVGKTALVLNACSQQVRAVTLQPTIAVDALPAGLYILQAEGVQLRFTKE